MLIDQIAVSLALTHKYVARLVKSASHHYKAYAIPRRAGGMRVIHHPSKGLKAIQRWLLREVIEGLPVHENSRAYSRGCTILGNAQAHVDSRFLLRMDFEDFFPSIHADDIRTYARLNPGRFDRWSLDDIDAFCRLVCRDNTLAIGAPTSPMLSNALCYELDQLLTALANRHATTYTRYADDLFFSTNEPNILRRLEAEVPGICLALQCPTHLRINARKTRHSSKRGARRVTGITLGSDGRTHLGRSIKRRIRSLVHRFDDLTSDQKASLRGWLAHATGIDPDFFNSLVNKYGLDKVHRCQRA